MPGQLTTHVLDTAHGKPAAGMKVDLCKFEREGTAVLKTVVTNADGRVDLPLLDATEIAVGMYELVFHVGDYFAHISGDSAKPRFLDQVPVRFGISDRHAHYHIPLLVSRFAYSTYRGS